MDAKQRRVGLLDDPRRGAGDLRLGGVPLGERKLISQLKSGNAEQRYAAIRSLEQNGSNRAREVVAEHLQDSDPNVAGRAALALGAMGQPENIQRLTQATGDQRAEVRQAAFVALGRTAGKVPIDYQKLIRALETDESAAVRAAVAWLWGGCMCGMRDRR